MTNQTLSSAFQRITRATAPISLGLCLGLLAVPAFAQGDKPVGTLGSILGKAHLVRGGKTLPVAKGMPVFSSDSLVTSEKTAVKILFQDGGTFMAFENASVKIEEYRFKSNGDGSSTLKSAFDIAKGKVRFFVKPDPNRKNDAKYKTSNAVMGIRGTSGFIDASKPGQTQLVVLTGKVEVSNPTNPAQKVLVPANQMTEVMGKGVPTPPREAPPTLVKSLNSEANRVENRGGPSGGGSGGGNEGRPEGGGKSGDGQGQDKAAPPAGEGGASGGTPQPQGGESPQGRAQPGSGDAAPLQPGAGESDTPASAASAPMDPQGGESGRAGAARPEGGANAPSGQNEPQRLDRKSVYNPDGSSQVMIKDEKLTALTAPPSAVVPGAPGSGAPGSGAPGSGGAARSVSAPGSSGNVQEIMRQVQSNLGESTRQAIQNRVEILQKQAAETPNAPISDTKKAVKVKIVLPSQ